jgi:nitrous oxide reductase accessory protein NosL
MAWAGDVTGVQHPMMNPQKYTDKGCCPNCGMNLNMWARTRHEFTNSEGEFATCSIRCLADISVNSNEKPTQVKVALYLNPEKMISADQAFYLIGSSAKGTMTVTSKVAFESKGAIEEFAAKAGGQMVGFNGALALATKELDMSRSKIEAKRKKKGKIEDPGPEVRCSVCGMFPARYPKHRCQLSTADGKRFHFCSSQCLVSFQENPNKYVKDAAKIKSVWVTIFPDGGFEYAMGLHFLVGSSLMGPMGKEALPYRSKDEAIQSAQKNGGKVVRFKALTPALVIGE